MQHVAAKQSADRSFKKPSLLRVGWFVNDVIRIIGYHVTTGDFAHNAIQIIQRFGVCWREKLGFKLKLDEEHWNCFPEIFVRP